MVRYRYKYGTSTVPLKGTYCTDCFVANIGKNSQPDRPILGLYRLEISNPKFSLSPTLTNLK